MIPQETLKDIARQHHTLEYPNVVREYCQHLFLSELYKLEKSGHMLFKGGTALRVIYGSPRFSEDLDFSIFAVDAHQRTSFIENLFADVLSSIERIGLRVTLGPKPGPTGEGYYGDATFQLHDYPSIQVALNISSRNGRSVQPEVDAITNDYIPTYTILHLPQADLVDEKVFGALLDRKKERDFYDLYFLLRKNMLTAEQKAKLAMEKATIVREAHHKDFQNELGAFLPQDQQAIIRNFADVLERELSRQVGV